MKGKKVKRKTEKGGVCVGEREGRGGRGGCGGGPQSLRQEK